MENGHPTGPDQAMTSATQQVAAASLRRQAGMEAVIDAYQAPLLRYAARVLNNATLAQDVVQNVLIKLFRQWQPGMQPDARAPTPDTPRMAGRALVAAIARATPVTGARLVTACRATGVAAGTDDVVFLLIAVTVRSPEAGPPVLSPGSRWPDACHRSGASVKAAAARAALPKTSRPTRQPPRTGGEGSGVRTMALG